MSSLPERTHIAWKWDLASGACAGVFMGAIWTFIPKIARDNMHASNTEMAWIIAAPALGFLFSTFWARQMDGRSKLPFCYITWLIARGMFLFIPFIHSAVAYVALACISPFIGSISAPAYVAVMKDIYPDHLRGRLMSVVRVASGVCTLLSSFIAGRLMDGGLDWHAVFFVGAIFGTATAYTFSRIPVRVSQDIPEEDRQSMTAFLADTLDIMRRNPGYRWFTLSIFTYGFGNLMASTLYPLYQVDCLHVTNTDVANLQNITSMMTMLSFLFWGGFMDRRGPLATVLAGISLICIPPVCYFFARDMTLLYVAAAAGGIASSGIDIGYLNTILLFAEPGKESQYQALHSSFFGIRGTLAPHCAIPMREFAGYRGAFAIAWGVMLTGVSLQLISMKDYRKMTRGRTHEEPDVNGKQSGSSVVR
jgi:Na+/melibiose symporter-like transporter